MDDLEYDHLVADTLQFRLPAGRWQKYPATSIDGQLRRFLREDLGIELELDTQTTVIRVLEDVLVRVE